ncbi:MAG: hypothetical protein SV062_09410 [Thermodesulfobacteriota bacterium]|nr:hypothetical protein [Thermodesulfobacteriota bacterium]
MRYNKETVAAEKKFDNKFVLNAMLPTGRNVKIFARIKKSGNPGGWATLKL